MSRKDVAREIQRRVDLAGDELPTSIESFIETHAGPSRQLSLRLNLCPGNREFFDPIIIDGKTLRTLCDAAQYITKLPKAEHDADEWQAAMEALLLVAKQGGPPMLARNGNAPPGDR